MHYTILKKRKKNYTKKKKKIQILQYDDVEWGSVLHTLNRSGREEATSNIEFIWSLSCDSVKKEEEEETVRNVSSRISR